jgi:cytochrome c-type biogenesis protein CcmH
MSRSSRRPGRSQRAVMPRLEVLAAAVAIGLIAPAIGLAATTPAVRTRASLPAIERRVMCVTCKIPLLVAESPQADRERAYISGLIGEGRTEAQIEHALVGQYGPAVLGLPSAHGFDLTAYLVPLAAVLALAATLALLPRWRRQARAQDGPGTAPALTDAETARLEADLARFDR